MDKIRINQAAQGVCSLGETTKWFAGHAVQEQRALIQIVGHLALQAGATPDDAKPAAKAAGIKPGAPACVLMGKSNPKVQFSKVMELPNEENLRSFSFFIGLLAVADARRRETKCAAGCRHWWHRDLGDEAVIDDILSSGEVRS